MLFLQTQQPITRTTHAATRRSARPGSHSGCWSSNQRKQLIDRVTNPELRIEMLCVSIYLSVDQIFPKTDKKKKQKKELKLSWTSGTFVFRFFLILAVLLLLVYKNKHELCLFRSEFITENFNTSPHRLSVFKRENMCGAHVLSDWHADLNWSPPMNSTVRLSAGKMFSLYTHCCSMIVYYVPLLLQKNTNPFVTSSSVRCSEEPVNVLVSVKSLLKLHQPCCCCRLHGCLRFSLF